MTVTKFLSVGVVCALIGLMSNVARADCSTNELLASSFEQSGQGNLQCANFTGLGGTEMKAVTQFPNASVDLFFSSGDKTVRWEIASTDPAVTGDIAIIEAADGKKCIYSYAGNVLAEPSFLKPSGTKRVKTVTICSDGVLAEEPPELPEPIVPIGTNDVAACENLLPSLQSSLDSNSDNANIDAIVGWGEDALGNPTLAVCTDQSLSNSGNAVNQVRCVDECVPRDSTSQTPLIPQDQCTPFPNGRLPLGCSRCLTADEAPIPAKEVLGIPQDANYCWEHESRVATTNNGATFRPAQLGSPGTARVERVKGSVCYKITTNFFGIDYTYYSPAQGCPCDPALDGTCININ